MADDYRHYTRTMAAVMAAQGHWDKAVEIYRHLLAADPESAEIRELLEKAERRARAAREAVKADLPPLFEELLRLWLAADNLRRLERLRGALGAAARKRPG